MKQKSMTALISAFSRAYHSENNEVKIFDDKIAKLILTSEEYSQISNSMSGGIKFFNPDFRGTQADGLRWIVDNQLSPTPLGRAAFTEKALQIAVSIGTRQYLILGAGYDTFAYRQPVWASRLQIFEIDHPVTAEDKRTRLETAMIVMPENVHYIAADFTKDHWHSAMTQNEFFDGNMISFCSILGVVYYLSRESFVEMISNLSTILSTGSAIAFDYPDENSYTEKAGERAKKQVLLASGANEKMLASYSYHDMEEILSDYGFLIYEHLTPIEITQQYFKTYNQANQFYPMTAFDNVNYCLAVKK